jgi:hypothetical protein
LVFFQKLTIFIHGFWGPTRRLGVYAPPPPPPGQLLPSATDHNNYDSNNNRKLNSWLPLHKPEHRNKSSRFLKHLQHNNTVQFSVSVVHGSQLPPCPSTTPYGRTEGVEITLHAFLSRPRWGKVF